VRTLYHQVMFHFGYSGKHVHDQLACWAGKVEFAKLQNDYFNLARFQQLNGCAYILCITAKSVDF
jgi:hypothetical protein